MLEKVEGEIDFDLTDPHFSVKSKRVHDLRDQRWFARTPYGLAALRYDEVREVLRSKHLRQGLYAWPAQNGVTEGAFAEWWKTNIITLEGDAHRRVRRLANPIFSTQVSEQFVDQFRALTNEIIDEFADKGECDFVRDFAEPFAARVILTMLAVPDADWRRLSRLAGDVGLAFSVSINYELPKIDAAVIELFEFVDELVKERRQNLGDDIISRLIVARDDEEVLSEDELRSLIVTLIFGGMDTSSNQISLAMNAFIAHPDQFKLLAAQPELGEAAVDEVMRLEPTVLWITREAIEDFEFHGMWIPKGTTIQVFTESANTDPSVGASAEFDIVAKDKPRNLTFGAGPHQCIGQFLARTDMREALPILAQRLKNPRYVGTPSFRPDSGTTGPTHMPIAFDTE